MDAGEQEIPPRRGGTLALQSTVKADRSAADFAVEDAESGPGRLIANRYRLVQRLGAGGHGEVWTADDLVAREQVAFKWLLGTGSARIRSEIAVLRLLRIPGVVRLLDEGIEDGRPFLIMERVHGRPFPGDRARAAGGGGRVPWSALAAPTLVLLDVLGRVHAMGVIHRDLKPDNILVTPDEHATILDFGISLWGPRDEPLTLDGQVIGTPAYLAPEQVLKRAADGRTDLFALGVMLYEALSGTLPHAGPHVQALVRARLTQQARPLQELAPEVPSSVAEIIDRMLARSMDERPRSAVEVLALLRGDSIHLQSGPELLLLREREPDQGDRPLDETALRALFAGPDRLFHLREDAARVLWERTGGIPARIEAEAALWVRLGIARRDGEVLAVDRDALARLRSGPQATEPAPSGALEAEPHLAEALMWLGLAGQPLEPWRLAEAMGQPLQQVEAAFDDVQRRGAVRRREDGRIELRWYVEPRWRSARRQSAHAALARVLRPGEEGRLFHLVAAGARREAAAEAVALARRRAQEGHLTAATEALREGLLAARGRPEDRGALESSAMPEDEVRLLETWVEVAFAEGTPRAFDRVLYELARASARLPEAARLETLARAGLAAPTSSDDHAMKLADSLPPFAEPELERRRQRVRVMAAAARSSPELLEQVLASVEEWAEDSGEPLARLTLAEGRARLRYVQGRFEDAAALYAEAAEHDPWLTGRIVSTVNSASALLEAYRHCEAAERAAAARDLASRCRHSYWEGRAEWLIRAASYRLAEATEPDLELVDAVTRLGVPDLEALVCFNEAAIAFRVPDPARAAELAGRAARVWQRMGRGWAEVLARCLEIAAGAGRGESGIQEEQISALADRALECRVPGIGLQALALLGWIRPGRCPYWRGALEPLTEGLPREHRDLRMDVLSVAEALAVLDG